jgi:hypothetical protein
MRSMVVSLTACAFLGILLGSRWSVRAHVAAENPSVQTEGQRYGGDNPGPVGVDFIVEPPTGRTTGFSCQVGVRSLVTGEGILLERFSAEPGKETKFRKSSKGLDVDVEVTIAAGGSSVSYATTVSTSAHTPLGIYSARLKLRN